MTEERKILETVKEKDLDGNSWKIERYNDIMKLYFKDYSYSIMTFATSKFEVFCDLRDLIREGHTEELKKFMRYDMVIADFKNHYQEPRIDLIFYN